MNPMLPALAGLAGLIAAPAYAGPGFFTIGVEPSVFAGGFGYGSNLHVYELPLTLRYHGDGWRVSLEVPGLVVSGAGMVTDGAAIRATTQSGTRVGLGDIWLSGDVTVARADGLLPELAPYVKLKMPTASRAQGLGTGAPDEEIGLRAIWEAGKLYPFLRAGYRFVGGAQGLQLHNAPVVEAGLSYRFLQGQYISLGVSHRGEIQTGAGPSELALAAYTVQLTPRLDVQLYALRGFTPDSPAYGFGLGATARF